MEQSRPACALDQRLVQIARWLEDEAPYVRFDQRHLDAGTPEQAYWHLGYDAALRDALRLLRDEAGYTNGTSNPCPPDGSGE